MGQLLCQGGNTQRFDKVCALDFLSLCRPCMAGRFSSLSIMSHHGPVIVAVSRCQRKWKHIKRSSDIMHTLIDMRTDLVAVATRQPK